MVDKTVVDIIESGGVDIILSVPCIILSGIITEIEKRAFKYISVCREEEGVGIAAGAALAGKKPMLLMQNSGLGNSINALMSLTRIYKLPLFILMSYRGGQGEKIAAQKPMGEKSPLLLNALDMDCFNVKNQDDLQGLGPFIKDAFESSRINAAFLSPELWDEEI